MRRIREEFDMPRESWERVAECVGGARSANLLETPDENLTEDQADQKAVEVLDYIYDQLETLPEGLGPLVLSRIVDDLSLQPALQLVTAQRPGATD